MAAPRVAPFCFVAELTKTLLVDSSYVRSFTCNRRRSSFGVDQHKDDNNRNNEQTGNHKAGKLLEQAAGETRQREMMPLTSYEHSVDCRCSNSSSSRRR